MLPARRRIRRREEFATVIRHGTGARGGLVVVHLAVPTGPPTAAHVQRAGFVVSGAVGNSVVRHRVQRRLRAAMAHELDRLPPGALVVVRALPGSAQSSYGSLSADLGRALRRAVTRGQDSN